MKIACQLLVIYLISLGVLLSVASFQGAAGYMDAEYYYSGAIQLYTGHGFSEMTLWNYLDDPAGLPHPSHGYWMPLASGLAMVGMSVLNSPSFGAARLGFVILASLIPLLNVGLSFMISKKWDFALLAGMISVVPVFYLVYLPITDTFGVCMLLGAAWFYLLNVLHNTALIRSNLVRLHLVSLLIGMVAGLMHLARVEGLIWLLVSLVVVWFSIWQRGITNQQRVVVWSAPFVCLSGYILAAGAWLARNLQVFGTPFSPESSRSFWLTTYDDLFLYPASGLTFQRWWDQGILELMYTRFWAMGQNLQTTVAVQGGIVLFPLILIGLWNLRRHPLVRWGVFTWFILFCLMTIVFPYQGARGGFFHAGAAFQPLFVSMVPVGLHGFIQWGARKRNWHPSQAWMVFSRGVVVMVIILGGLVAASKLTAQVGGTSAWNLTQHQYQAVESCLAVWGVGNGEVVMVNNPPGYFSSTGRPAIVIPNGDIESLLQAGRRYLANYVLLESNHPAGLAKLYVNPGERDGLEYMGGCSGVHLFKIH